MAYEILIAVRDAHVVSKIKNTIKKSHESIKTTVMNGSADEAMKKVAAYGINIVFMDVDINGCGGIEALTRIRKAYPKTHVVIVSPYDDYELVRHVFIKGADDCLFYKSHECAYEKTLERICEKIRQENIEIHEKEIHENDIQVLEKMAQNSFMYSVLFRATKKEDLAEYKRMFGLKERGFVLNVEVAEGNYGGNTDNSWGKSLLKDVLNDDEKCMIGPMIFNRITMIISSDYGKKSLAQARANQLAKHIIDISREKWGMKVCVGIGNYRRLENAHLSYEESIKALRYKQTSDIVSYSVVASVDRVFDIEEFNNDIRQIEDYLNNGNYEITSAFGSVLDKMKKLNETTRKNKILEIIIYMTHKMSELGPSACDYVNVVAMAHELDQLNAQEIDAWAMNRMQLVIKAMRDAKRARISEPVRIAKQYMTDHYKEEISLVELAEKIGVSSQYFSKIFKEETGYNFIEWLNTVRINKAKELMKLGNVTMKETAYLVGYNDPNYFSRAFKKYAGMTPSEYIKVVRGKK